VSNPNLSKFDHIVVLVMENRSFDNVLGYLYENDRPSRFIGRGEPEFRGVAGHEQELFNLDEQGQRVYVGKAPFDSAEEMCMPCPDPGEFYTPHVNRQIYNQDVVPTDTSKLPDPAPMSGFVQDYIRTIRTSDDCNNQDPPFSQYRAIMNCFPPEAIPVTSGLARAFGVSDEWFASVPSQTFCNRSFLNSGQSHGFVTNSDYVKWVLDNRGTTVFERLTGQLGPAKDWTIYWDEEDVLPVTSLIHPQLDTLQYCDNFRHFSNFERDCAEGTLPAYSFIQPRLILNHNDMHPPVPLNFLIHSSVLAGELLINTVYNAVRTGRKWERTLLVITFDEHGGTYDHWPPPLGARPPVQNPPYPLESGFGFDRFGVRVPAIFVSPYVAEGTVVRASGAVPFDHTSLIRTIAARWELDGITERDQAAPDFADVLSLDQPRLETPAFQPRHYIALEIEKFLEAPLRGLQQHITSLLASRLGGHIAPDTKTGDAMELLKQLKAARAAGHRKSASV
jgi:phospholipase C